MSIILEPGRLSQKDHEFKSSLGYIVGLVLNRKPYK